MDYRIRDGPLDSADLVVKLRMKAKEGKTSSWWMHMKLFERETEFYTKVLPRIESIIGWS